MALIPFFSKGILYDTWIQMAICNQVVDRFVIGTGAFEKYVVLRVDRSKDGYTYQLLNLGTYKLATTRYIFDTKDVIDGYTVNCAAPIILPQNQVDRYRHKAEQVKPAIKALFLNSAAQVIDYSERCLAIFTDNPNDCTLLNSIQAKQNRYLRLDGKRMAGWILPKCRREQLSRIWAQ